MCKTPLFRMVGIVTVIFISVMCYAAERGFVDITVNTVKTTVDFPPNRCGGHANTGVRWTAPQTATVDITGSVWKMRDRATHFSLWLNDRKLIDNVMVRGTSQAPYTLDKMVSNPKTLKNLSIKSGDEIYVQISDNDFVGLDLTIGKWDLSADFSDQNNPNDPWTYGQVVVDESQKPNLVLFESHTEEFEPADFGKGQSAWYSKNLPWYYSMMKSKGNAPSRQEVRFTSGQTIYVETLQDNRWVGCYWSADGRINVPHETWADNAFELGIGGELIVDGWQTSGIGELPKTEEGARYFTTELIHIVHPLKVKVHTLLDGTAVLTRWLEITNTSGKSVALTAVAPWSGRLWPGDSFTLGYFTKQDWAFEGWLQWEPLKEPSKVVQSHEARAHDDPFFIVRNDKIGEYFIGHLAWSSNWKLQFDRDQSGLLFKAGPAVENDALRVIAAGETITTPAVHLGLVSGNLDGAVQAMHEHVRDFVLPKRKPQRSYLVQYLVPADQGYYVPFDESSAFKCVDVAAAIGAELFILDYGWWDVTGDWYPSQTRFPHGLQPLIDYVHKKDMLFGIYVRTEGDSGDIVSSKAGREHPDWIGPSSTINLQIPQAAAWVESEVARLTEEHHLDLYRLDYNPSFKFTETSRDGIMENNCWRYYEAFYGMYERIHQKYPDLILQQASAGGGRNDLGTVSRFHEPYLTDGLWLPRELQIYSGLTLGLPPEIFVILHGAHSGGRGTGLPQRLDTILRMSYATSTPQIFVGTVAPSIETLTPERKTQFLHYDRIYKKFIRPLLPTCKMYHHAPISADGGVESSPWFAMEYASPDKHKGWAFIARINNSSQNNTYLFKPRGLTPTKTYRVTYDSLGQMVTVKGQDLMNDGLSIPLETIMSSELLLFEAK